MDTFQTLSRTDELIRAAVAEVAARQEPVRSKITAVPRKWDYSRVGRTEETLLMRMQARHSGD